MTFMAPVAADRVAVSKPAAMPAALNSKRCVIIGRTSARFPASMLIHSGYCDTMQAQPLTYVQHVRKSACDENIRCAAGACRQTSCMLRYHALHQACIYIIVSRCSKQVAKHIKCQASQPAWSTPDDMKMNERMTWGAGSGEAPHSINISEAPQNLNLSDDHVQHVDPHLLLPHAHQDHPAPRGAAFQRHLCSTQT